MNSVGILLYQIFSTAFNPSAPFQVSWSSEARWIWGSVVRIWALVPLSEWSSNHTWKCNTVRVSLSINFYLEKFNANSTNYMWNDVSCCIAHMAPLQFCAHMALLHFFSEGDNSSFLNVFFFFLPTWPIFLLFSFLFFNNGGFCSISLKVKKNTKRENKLDFICWLLDLCCNWC